MIKDIEKNNGNVAINTKEIAVLKEHFPACFKKDGSFDIERFKEDLKDKVDIVHEGYELKFLGKSYAKLLASLDTTTVITPNTAHNNLPENKNSENIYISGDNLDGLKHLLKSYSKSVKCIYIDPPYNTGSDGFVYKDKFNFTADELQDKLSVDETQANRIIDLTKRNSASHSAWLMFMYSRLQLAKDLLKDDGVIFISIDDNEQANLKLLCDDIFGEENFVTQFIWRRRKTQANLSKHISPVHDYLLCISRNKEKLIINKLPYSAEFIKKTFSNPDKDFRGLYQTGPIARPANSSNKEYTLTMPNGRKITAKWSCSSETFDKYVKEDRLVIPRDGEGMPRIKIFLNELEGQIPNTWLDNIATNDEASKEIEELLGSNAIFSYPKPVKLISHILKLITNEKDIVLDFFSGSATTANAVIKLNSEDNGNRKFIAVQLPEILDAKNPTQKPAFNFLTKIKRPTTLDYVGIERIIRAAKIIKEETKVTIDYGFKHFILNEPNQNTLDKCETFDKVGLLADATILDDFGAETVLTTWLNYDGYGFNAKVQTIDLNGYEAYYCNKHLYLINPDFSQNSVVALFEKYDTISNFNPENIVLFGYSFIEWSVTEMLEKNLKILNDSEKNLKINIDVRY